MELRKHVKDMSEWEIRYIKKLLSKKHSDISPYCIERMVTRGITQYELNDAITNGEIIEFHLKGGEPRVLLRSSPNKNNLSTCVVVILTTGRVITTYQNESTDNHKTLDYSKYKKHCNVVKLIKNLILQ